MRPEAVETGYAKFIGIDIEAIYEEIERRIDLGWPIDEYPCGTGDTAKKIVDVIDDTIAP